MTKMDPTASDRWWRSRIEKEETAYVNNGKKVPKSQLAAEAATGPREATAAVSHLLGAGALVRGSKPAGAEAPPPEATSPSGRAGSVAGSKANDDARSTASGASKKAGSVAASGASRKTGATEALMSRLSKLEQELGVERERREMAEREMAEIMAHVSAASPGAAPQH